MRRFVFLLAASALAAGCATVPPTPPLAITSHVPAAADYPIESVSLREQGATTVQYLVLADGTVGDTIIASPSGSPRLDQAAVRLVTQAVKEQRRAYVLVNNRSEGHAPGTVKAIREMLMDAQTADAP